MIKRRRERKNEFKKKMLQIEEEGNLKEKFEIEIEILKMNQNHSQSVSIYNDILTLILETGVEQKAGAVDRIRRHIDSLERENNDLKNKMIDYEKNLKENSDLKNENDFLESRIEILETQIKQYQNQQNALMFTDLSHVNSRFQQQPLNQIEESDSVKRFHELVKKLKDESMNNNNVGTSNVSTIVPKPNVTTQLTIPLEQQTMAQRIASQISPSSVVTEEVNYDEPDDCSKSYYDSESVISIDVLNEYRFMNEILKKENTEIFMTLISIFKYAGTNKKAQIPQAYRNDWKSLHELTGYLFFRGNDGKPWFVFEGQNYPVLTEFGKERFNEFLRPTDERDLKALDTIQSILNDNKFLKTIKQQLQQQSTANKVKK